MFCSSVRIRAQTLNLALPRFNKLTSSKAYYPVAIPTVRIRIWMSTAPDFSACCGTRKKEKSGRQTVIGRENRGARRWLQ